MICRRCGYDNAELLAEVKEEVIPITLPTMEQQMPGYEIHTSDHPMLVPLDFDC